MNQDKLFLIISFCVLCLGINLFGQNKNQLNNTNFDNAKILLDSDGQSPSAIKFPEGNQPTVASFFDEYKQTFPMSEENSMQVSRISDNLIGTHHRFNQFYKGIEIIGAQFILHEKNGTVWSANGKLVPELKLDVNPKISEQAALQAALQNVNADVYMWQNPENEAFIKKEQNDVSATFIPKGELKLTSGNEEIISDNIKLVYRFDIYAQEPFGRYWVDVDANTGEIVNKISRMHNDMDVTATNTTLYNGPQSITVNDDGAGTFTTQEHTTRGAAILTYDLHSTGNFGGATLFSAGTSTGFSDAAGVSTHFGAEATYDYYLNEHGRNSLDDAGFTLFSYAHYLTNLNNAYWDGSRMLYGDGDGVNFTPLVGLDVCGHELTHGVTQFSSNLIYSGESGGLNESFSDIFGNLVEFSKEGDPGPDGNGWRIGEEITTNGLGIRNMADPNEFNDPDTYLGNHWVNEVHTTSGVQNFWFYLLSEGGNGTNDNGYLYSVTGIGINDAAIIAYLNNTSFLTPGSDYSDACSGSLLSAEAYFGVGSQQAISTAEAWFAVGVQGSALISVSPTDLTFYTPLNGTGTGQLNVSNTGGLLSQDLVWSASVETLPYAYIDSDAPGGPIFNWIDITGTGTPVTLDDDDDILITLPFTFPFYGEDKTNVRIGSNGYLTFGTAGSTFTNTNIPNTVNPNDIICPFWDDLDPTLGGTIHYLSTASQFIVQYTGIIHFGKLEPNTFQVILNADGSILFQYLDMQGNVNESTVGVEISDGMNGLQVAYNNTYIHNNLAVQIFSLPAVTWISSISPSSGTTAAGTSEQVTVSYDATGLTVGTYNGNILIGSNAANIPSLIVPVTLTVQAPLLTSTINDVTVFSNNDGTPDEGSFSVDNTPANILFNSFIEQNGSTDPLLKVYQTIALTNVTVPFCNNCWATMEAFAGATGTAALVNTALPGTLVMSFRAWIDDNNDGVVDASEPAGDWVVYTVTVNPELSTSISAVVFGTNSVVLKEKSKIISGDVVVNDVGSGVELTLEEKVSTPSGYSLKANRIYVDKKAKIYSDVFYNELTNKGSIYGSLNTPLDLPVYSSLPPFNEAPAGTEDKTVLKNQTLTLAPGDYRDIKVKEKGTLIFSGGIYNLRKLDAEQKAKLVFSAASEVRIEEKFSAGEKSVVGPKNGSGISASDIVFYVKGADPNAAKFGEKNKTKANFYVPNGTLLIKEKSNATGSFLARDVVIGGDVKVTMESAFNNSLNKISSQQEQEEELVFNTIPEKYELMQNYPNPFNPSTVIMFALPEDAVVSLVVYDILGSKVAELVSGDIAAGIHEVAFDAANLTSGIYFYRLTSGSYTQINKMILLK